MRTLIIGVLFFMVIMPMKSQLVYHDASGFPVLGKATQQTETRYERLPYSLKGIVRQPLWERGKNSTGLAIRFRSNSTTIGAKWSVLYDRNEPHITATNVKGLDLYCLVDGEWRFVNSGRPTGKINEATIISNMNPEDREYMLYLSLSDCVTSLSVGVDSTAYVSIPMIDFPVREKPVVCYGTSIMQGISASRPGMAFTNILSRRFNREFINLGFSGNGKLDYEIAELMANVDASLFLLDFVPNASVTEIREKTEHFYSIIRAKHPNTPVIFVEDPIFTHTLFDRRIAKEVYEKNIAINETVALLKKKYEDQNIVLISSKEMIGNDGEATVDGIHFTDLGFMRYADLLTPVIKKWLSNQ
jgi:hypothetical protein